MPCNTVVRAILEASADSSGALAQNFLAWSQNGRLNLYNMLADGDGDGDGILSPTDNCLDIANTGQTNTDGDPQGNACDLDDDNDGLSDDDEIGIYGTNPLLDTSFPILYTGDANNDGTVNAADLIIAMRILLGEATATPLQLSRIDVAPLVTGIPAPDGQFNAGDYTVLVQKVNGRVTF
jgi:hypothetical protein